MYERTWVDNEKYRRVTSAIEERDRDLRFNICYSMHELDRYKISSRIISTLYAPRYDILILIFERASGCMSPGHPWISEKYLSVQVGS